MPLLCGTHSGSFHADDVLALALIRAFEDPDAQVIRSRDQDALDRCDVVFDVGGVFDPAGGRFDHHQNDYEGPLSSAGMVLAWLETNGSVEPELAARLRREALRLKLHAIGQQMGGTAPWAKADLGAKGAIQALIASDEEVREDYSKIESVEQALRYRRDFVRLLRNFVNFSEFYQRKGATFQAGTLYLDSRSTEFCIQVAGPSPLASLPTKRLQPVKAPWRWRCCVCSPIWTRWWSPSAAAA